MEEKIKEIVAYRDLRLEEAKKETDEKLRFAGICAANAVTHVLSVLGYEEPEEEVSKEELDALIDSLLEE